MRFWWVNQNKTFEPETRGGYLWSPKRKSNGDRNPFYEFMREVSPGDLVLSFQGTFIRAIGVALSYAYESPKPPEFGAAGPNWESIGWRVDVHYNALSHQIKPSNYMHQLASVLPKRYSPLRKTGQGLQSVYLTAIPANLMNVLAELIGPEADSLMYPMLAETNVDNNDSRDGLVEWEEHLRRDIEGDNSISETQREQVILARLGQGRFKQNVRALEVQCRITGVDRIEHLRASHIKPWRDCADHNARLDGENGLLLTPSVDHLFDRGFISFEDNGRLLVSPIAHKDSLFRMGIPAQGFQTGKFNFGQRAYLEFHRESVFLCARTN